jgi:ABC-2 type transport system permease protein
MGFALHAEWTKFRTLAGGWWLLLAAAALTIVVSAAAAAATGCQPGACAAAATGLDPAKTSLSGVILGQVIVALAAVLAIGGEYSTGMIRLTLTAMPRRLTMLAAKAAVVTGWALAAGVLAVLGSVLAGRLILPARGLTTANGYVLVSLANGPDLRAAAGSVLYLALIALLALGITTAVRDSGVAIGAALALLFLFPIVNGVISDPALHRHLEQIAPMTAGLYIQATTNAQSLPLTPWQGLGVLAAWAFGALILGAVVLRLRDALPSPEPACRPRGREVHVPAAGHRGSQVLAASCSARQRAASPGGRVTVGARRGPRNPPAAAARTRVWAATVRRPPRKSAATARRRVPRRRRTGAPRHAAAPDRPRPAGSRARAVAAAARW